MKKDIDKTIKDVFRYRADAIEASSEMKQRIDQMMEERETNVFRQERSLGKMRKWNMKKAAAAAVGAILLTGGVCFAASGKATILVTSGTAMEESSAFTDLAKAEEIAGIDINAVETFSNGYRFESLNVHDTAALGEDGQTMYEYKEIVMRYGKDGEPTVSITAEDAAYGMLSDKTPDVVRECGDITIYYNEYTMKCVPMDYELTEEDIANEEQDNYWITYGSEEVEIRQTSVVVWEADGVFYDMMGFDLTLSAEELLDMAEEIINAR